MIGDLPKYLTESIDNLVVETTELRAMNAQLRDALKSLLDNPKDDTTLAYAKYVLLKSERQIGRK
jgi:hypothetical protein